VPRKYRPPAARRRKSKRQPPYFVEPLPESGDEAAAQDGAGPSTLENAEVEVAVAVAPKPGPVQARAAERPTATTVKHITKDYSYVPAEVRRILLVAGFLIVCLIVTALLRN
jgi:hypothetical protein